MVIMEDPYREKRQRRARQVAKLKAEGAARGEIYDDIYWEIVYDFEYAPWVTDYAMLTEVGVEMPPAASLHDDGRLTECLWNIIERLASWDVYLMLTNHLSDRALYVDLTEETLREPRRDFIPGMGTVCVYHILDDSDAETYLKYYANDRERAAWNSTDDLDIPMPPRSDPPYDRDRFLPEPSS